ncbi:MAG: trigger factor [Deltaproteobacteria bacterium]|nr:trigger factor [Deltaproteobacteria bacterium]
MQVTVKDISSVKKILSVEIPQEEVSKELTKAYKAFKSEAKIKGFRKGKAPKALIKKLYEKNVKGEAVTALTGNTFQKALEETGFTILGEPSITPGEIEEEKPYNYEVAVEIEPKIEDIDFSGLKIKKNLYTVSEEEITAQLEALKQSAAEYEPVKERPAQNEDYISIDYKAYKDGKKFDEIGDVENFKVKIGDAKIFPEFSQNIIGMNIGEEKNISVAIPENDMNKKLAGNTFDFKVTLKEIRKQILPELDDKFAKKYGEDSTLETLTNRITENLKQGYEKRAHQELIEQIFQSIIEKTEFEVPEVLIKHEQKIIVADALKTFQHYNTSLESLGLKEEEFAEKYRVLAKMQAKRYLILKHLIKQEKLELTDNAIEEAYKENAQSIGMPVEEVKKYYESNKDNLKYLENALLEKQIIDLIISKSEIEEITPEKEESNVGEPTS